MTQASSTKPAFNPALKSRTSKFRIPAGIALSACGALAGAAFGIALTSLLL